VPGMDICLSNNAANTNAQQEENTLVATIIDE